LVLLSEALAEQEIETAGNWTQVTV
jgi:hypothetical protein